MVLFRLSYFEIAIKDYRQKDSAISSLADGLVILAKPNLEKLRWWCMLLVACITVILKHQHSLFLIHIESGLYSELNFFNLYHSYQNCASLSFIHRIGTLLWIEFLRTYVIVTRTALTKNRSLGTVTSQYSSLVIWFWICKWTGRNQLHCWFLRIWE